jgi:hypothetical protein
MYKPITFDPQMDPDALMAHGQLICEDFPYDDIAKQMKQLGLKWKESGKEKIPTKKAIKDKLNKLIQMCIDDKRPICYYQHYQLIVVKVGDKLNAFFNLYAWNSWDLPLISDAMELYRQQALPESILKLRDEMVKIRWIGDVSYPSYYARMNGLGNNYLACSGDGLLSLLFEVINLDEGKLRYHNLYHDDPKGADGYPSAMGKRIHQLGVKHDDVITFTQLIEHIKTIVGDINQCLDNQRNPFDQKNSSVPADTKSD